MATLYEYYDTGWNDAESSCGTYWNAQTFTPSVAHKITSVKLQLLRAGSPGTVTVGIRATDSNGHPTGNDLCSGAINGNNLIDTYPGEWYEIALGEGYDLVADTKYAIVIRAPDGDNSNYVSWFIDYTNLIYTRGNWEYNTDYPSNPWTTVSSADFMFEEWGIPPAVGRSFGFIIG